jgi:hypothetical protein
MAKTAITIICDTATKKAIIVGTAALRETITVTLTSSGTFGAADLVLGLVENGVLLASIPQGSFSGTGPNHITGDLNLNTNQMIAYFSADVGRTIRKITLCLWDITNQALVLNSTIDVINNPYSDGMEAPTDALPIGHGEYAPIENGVTGGNSHVHQNGDGGDLSPYFIVRVPANGFFRQSTDGLDLECKDRVDGLWRPLISYGGLPTFGDPV